MGADRRLRSDLKNRGVEPTDRLVRTLGDLDSIGDKAGDAVFTFLEGGSVAQLMRDLAAISSQVMDAILVISKEVK